MAIKRSKKTGGYYWSLKDQDGETIGRSYGVSDKQTISQVADEFEALGFTIKWED